ncbi:MAG: Flp family type IVb pilin [Proteobacteria bacterium]|nr:Flp family type IVb pilin [Pseudomonadota bacterium]
MFKDILIVPRSAAVALRNRRGVSSTEYTLMVVGIAALVLAGAQLLGGDISTALNSIGTYLTGAAASI